MSLITRGGRVALLATSLQVSPELECCRAVGLTTGNPQGATMKTRYVVALAVVTGFGFGAIAVQGLHAQATPKAYVVTEIEVINQEAQNAYLPKVGAVIKSTGGTYLARGAKIVALEGGEAPKRVTIVVYDSLEKAQASRKSPAWTALKAERDKALKAKSYVIEGVPN